MDAGSGPGPEPGLAVPAAAADAAAATKAPEFYEPVPDTTRIPWEEPGGRNLRGFLATSRLVLSAPSRFFHAVPRHGGLGAPFAFAALWTVAGTLGGFGTRLCLQALRIDAWAWTVRLLSDAAAGAHAGPVRLARPGVGAPELPFAHLHAFLDSPCVALPLGYGLALAELPLVALVLHASVRIAGGRGFGSTWRVVCYASAVEALSLVPIAGAGVAGLVWVAVVLVGLRFALDLSLGRSVVALLLPPLAFALAFATALLALGALLTVLGAGR